MDSLPAEIEPRFTKATLSNGLDVVARRQGSLPIVAVNLWYHVGSKDETRGRRGFAHLFEHLMFEGSEHYPGDFFRRLQPLGAGVNGSTSTDRTNYYIDLPTAHVELALAMESDRMGFLLPALSEETLRIQQGVVTNEYLQNYANRPYGQAWKILFEALYPETHPYSWQTIGVMEDVQAATLGDVEAFFRRHYIPANASLSLVGDLDEDEAIRLAERYFGPIPGGIRPPRPRVATVPLARTERLRLLDRVELDRSYDVWPSVPQFHPDDAALGLLADVLGRGRVSRLYRLLVEPGIAQNVSVHQSGRELAGTFSVVVTLRPGRSVDAARDVLFEELAKLADSGPEPDELLRAQNGRLAATIYALDGIGGFGGVADRLNAFNVFLGDPGRFVSDIRRYQDATPDDVRRVAAGYLASKPRVVLDVVGQRAAATTAPDRATPPPPKAPSPYRAPVPEILRLSCGAELWILADRQLPIVSTAAVVQAGATAHGPDRAGLAYLTALALDEGTRRHDAHALARAVEGMGSQLSTSCGYHGSSVFIQSLKAHAEDGWRLAAEVALEPTFPAAEVDRLRGQVLASLRAERDSAEARAHRALLKAIYPPGHPFRVPVDGEVSPVSRLGRADTEEFHLRQYRPDRSAWIVAGDVDVDSTAAWFEDALNGWGGEGPQPPSIPATREPDRPRIWMLDRPGAPQAVVRAGHIGIARSDEAYPEIVLFNQILGGQFSSRLNRSLREERGLTYGVRSHLDARREPGPFWIGASLQEDRVGESITLIRSELIDLLDGRPPDQRELEDARRSLIEAQARHFEGPAALVSRFGNLFLQGLPPDEYRRAPDRLAAVTLESIRRAAPRVFRPGALTFVVVADLDKVRPQLEACEWATCERIDDLAETSLTDP